MSIGPPMAAPAGRRGGIGPLRIVSLAMVAAAGLAFTSSRVPPSLPLPNILIILTDDQDVDSLGVTGNVQPHLVGKGVTFSQSFVQYSQCCPGRHTLMTGQQSTNHGVRSNVSTSHGGYGRADFDYTNTLYTWLSARGYYVGFMGKVANGYGEIDAPTVPGTPPYEILPGVHDFRGTIDPYSYNYYGSRWNVNGSIVSYGTAEADYIGDVLGGFALEFLDLAGRGGQPFFLIVNFLAPHTGRPGGGYAVPSARYNGVFEGVPMPVTASTNEQDMSDKPAFLRLSPKLTPRALETIRVMNQRRLESLLTVDEYVGKMIATMEAAGALDNTVIIFTSDNGWIQAGQHRILRGKTFAYESSIRVPLLIRGPGIRAGVTVDSLVSNIDLVPTIVELADLTAGRAMDGRSLVPLLRGTDEVWRTTLFIEAYEALSPLNFSAVRTDRFKYIRYRRVLNNETGSTVPNGEEELYDLSTDPDEMQSLHDSRSQFYQSVKADLKQRLTELERCAGGGCFR